MRVAGAASVSGKDSACVRITAAPAPDLDVRVTDTNDPIRLGGETTCRVSIRNTGATDVTRVTVRITLPAGLRLKENGDVRRPVANYRHKDGVIEFDPVTQLRKGESPLNYEFTVVAVTAGADQPVVARITADGLSQAIQATSKTTVLAD